MTRKEKEVSCLTAGVIMLSSRMLFQGNHPNTTWKWEVGGGRGGELFGQRASWRGGGKMKDVCRRRMVWFRDTYVWYHTMRCCSVSKMKDVYRWRMIWFRDTCVWCDTVLLHCLEVKDVCHRRMIWFHDTYVWCDTRLFFLSYFVFYFLPGSAGLKSDFLSELKNRVSPAYDTISWYVWYDTILLFCLFLFSMFFGVVRDWNRTCCRNWKIGIEIEGIDSMSAIGVVCADYATVGWGRDGPAPNKIKKNSEEKGVRIFVYNSSSKNS